MRKFRYLLITVIMVSLVAVSIVLTDALQFSAYVNSRALENLDRAAVKLRAGIGGLGNAADMASLILARDGVIVSALESGDERLISSRAEALNAELGLGVSAIVVSDAAGNVLSFYADDGVETIQPASVLSAALTDEGLIALPHGGGYSLFVVSAAIVASGEDSFLGAIAAGIRIGEDGFMDELRNITGADFVFYVNGESVASTVLAGDGNRQEFPLPEAAFSAMESGEYLVGPHMLGLSEILGKYSPLRNNAGEIVGISLAFELAEVGRSAVFGFVLLGGAISLIILVLAAITIVFSTRNMNNSMSALTRKVYFDNLTGIYNRRYFDENIERIIQAMARSFGILSVIMIDVDRYKQFNDTYGHNRGDVCLKKIAEALNKNVKRAGDFVVRYGGEEFVVVMPGTGGQGATQVAKNLLSAVRDLGIAHESSDVTDHVTVSMGVATSRASHTQKGSDYIDRADELLYIAKNSGRDRFVFGALKGNFEDEKQNKNILPEDIENQHRRRAKMFKALSQTIETFSFFGDEDFTKVLAGGISPICEVMNIDRVVGIRAKKDENEEQRFGIKYRWSRMTAETDGLNNEFETVPDKPFVAEWFEKLSAGECINSRIEDLSDDAREYLSAFGVKCIFAVPIFNFGEFWGAVLLEDLTSGEFFQEGSVESDLLHAAGQSIGNAIIRTDRERLITRTQTALTERENLLDAVTQVAEALLSAKTGNVSLPTNELGIIGRSLNVDRVQVWYNEMHEYQGKKRLHYVMRYSWTNEIGKNGNYMPVGSKFAYDENPWRLETFAQGRAINSPISLMHADDREIHEPYGIVSIAMQPLFQNGEFIGFISVDDCVNERAFTAGEMNMLASTGLMFASFFSRIEQTEYAKEADERTALMFDAMPLSCQLWSRDFEIFDCNKAGMELFGFDNKQDLFNRFRECSPEYQPDGKSSARALRELVHRAFEEGVVTYKWTHIRIDSKQPFPAEVILVRVKYKEDFVIAAYTRDLREQDQMQTEIENRDYLLRTINDLTANLLKSDADSFKFDLWQSMGMLGEAMDINRMSIFKNYTKDGELFCTQIHEWSEGVPSGVESWEQREISYSQSAPEALEAFSLNSCINGIVRGMDENIKAILEPEGIISVLLVPIFLSDEFWGFIGVDDREKERVFSHNEEMALRSAGFVMVQAITRHAQAGKTDSEKTDKTEILLCEDNEMNRLLMNEYLSRLEIKTINAENGREGVYMVQKRLETGEKMFDIILMDINMPIMNGTDATKAIKKLGVNIPVIAVTANSLKDSGDEYSDAGMVGFLGKPFTQAELKDCLSRFLDV